jgi:HK97 family phage portal protein
VTGADRVLGLAAVYSCVRYIADAVASLPVNVYRMNPDGSQIKLPGSQLLDNPSADPSTTIYDWLFQAMTSALLWGNSWGLISSRTGVNSPNGLGYPQTIEWLPPERVSVEDDEQQPFNTRAAKVYFDGQQIPRQQLVQVRAFVVPGKLAAVSPLRAFALLMEQGIDALQYTATWFRNGGFPPGTFQNLAEEVGENDAKEIRRRLTETLQLRQPLVYGKDWDYKPVVVPPNEAAFIQAMQLNATQIAAVYGVPPTKVGGARGDSLTYSTQEQETLSLITDTLRPWLVRLEGLFTQLLPKPQFARFNTDALLKTDLKSRVQIEAAWRDMGLRTIDEIRAIEDLPPYPGSRGNEFIPLKVLERMASTTRAIPNSYMNDVTMEATLAAEMLEELQAKGLTAEDQPGVPPIAVTPTAYLGRQLTTFRSKNGQGEEQRTEPAGPVTGAAGAPRDRGIEEEEPRDHFFGPPHQLATRTDRQRASDWVTLAQRAGCLDDEESGTRRRKAGKARTKGILDEIVKDLPAETELRALPIPAPAPQPAPNTAGSAAQTLLQLRKMSEGFVLNGSGSQPR